jgi:hypothetical protein
MEYSPTFADKKALDTRQMDLEEIADVEQLLPPGRVRRGRHA